MSTAISSVKREGTTTYDPRVLEANWYEERSRQEVGEKVYLELMDGAVIAPLDPTSRSRRRPACRACRRTAS